MHNEYIGFSEYKIQEPIHNILPHPLCMHPSSIITTEAQLQLQINDHGSIVGLLHWLFWASSWLLWIALAPINPGFSGSLMLHVKMGTDPDKTSHACKMFQDFRFVFVCFSSIFKCFQMTIYDFKGFYAICRSWFLICRSRFLIFRCWLLISRSWFVIFRCFTRPNSEHHCFLRRRTFLQVLEGTGS